MRKNRIRNTAMLLSFGFLIPLAVFVIWVKLIDSRSPLPVFNKDHSMTQFALFNQQNNTEGPEIFKDKIIVVNFFFTHCPGICAKVINNMSAIHDVFNNDSSIEFVSISVDPDRDSVERLNEYIRLLKLNDNHWSFLTGDKKAVYTMARNDFQLVAAQGAPGEDDFIHSDNIVLMDRATRIRGYYKGTNKEQVKQLITDIKKLQNDPSALYSRR